MILTIGPFVIEFEVEDLEEILKFILKFMGELKIE